LAESKDLASLLDRLTHFDQAVATQAAYLWQKRGHSLASQEIQQHLIRASPDVRAGFMTFTEAWQETERARVEAGR
jgi:hypothetical protein